MKSFIGKYSEKNFTEPVDATILLLPKHLSIGFNNQNNLHTTQKWLYKNIDVSYDAANNLTTLKHALHNQYLFVANDVRKDVEACVLFDKKNWFAKKMAGDGWKVLTVIAIMVALLIAVYFLVVPYLSEQLAKKIPVKYETSIGNKLFSTLVDSTKKDKELSALLNTYFKNLEIKTAYPINITVIKDPMVNAFAIMGGNIIVHTGLLQRIKTHQELAALLSHEFTHINNKHTTRTVFRTLGGKVFLSLLFGNMTDVSAIVIGNTENLTTLGYGRGLEKEADNEGLTLLQQRNINNNGFIDLFKNLKTASGNNDVAEILSSHPDIDKRIAYLKNNKNFNQGDSTTTQNQKLRAIFSVIRGDSDF